MEDILNKIVDDDKRILNETSLDELEGLAELICNKKRLFVCGTGRSLLMIKAFAMRIMHLGISSYVVGDVTTPAITKDDLLVVASGSGETSSLKAFVNKAKTIGASVAHITTNPESTIAKSSDYVLTIKASTNHLNHNGGSWQPAANSFEQCLLMVGDALTIIVAEKLNVDISGPLALHANLE